MVSVVVLCEHPMEDCVFCRIVAKQLPANILYEDERYIALMDVFPRVKGHTLVIPKTHYRWTYDVPNFGEYWEVAKKIALVIQADLGAAYTSFLTVGEEVPHAHIHILPQPGDHLGGIAFKPIIEMTPQEISELAGRIKITLTQP